MANIFDIIRIMLSARMGRAFGSAQLQVTHGLDSQIRIERAWLMAGSGSGRLRGAAARKGVGSGWQAAAIAVARGAFRLS